MRGRRTHSTRLSGRRSSRTTVSRWHSRKLCTFALWSRRLSWRVSRWAFRSRRTLRNGSSVSSVFARSSVCLDLAECPASSASEPSARNATQKCAFRPSTSAMFPFSCSHRRVKTARQCRMRLRRVTISTSRFHGHSWSDYYEPMSIGRWEISQLIARLFSSNLKFLCN